MSTLFSSFTMRGVVLRNRIVVSPMCQYSGHDGFANEWHLVHLGSRAVGGAGAVFMEATAVSPEGRISDEDLGIWKDGHVLFLKTITGFISEYGAVPGIQLAHAGRKASHNAEWKGARLLQPSEGGWEVVAPSPVPFSDQTATPREITRDDIFRLVGCFAEAARRSVEAGFRIIEIHAAHGYLIHEFFSPLSNRRTDEYGGSFANRIRFLTEIVASARTVLPGDLALFVRISSSDWADGGWTPEDSVELSRILKSMGVDLMDCSSGGIIPGVKIPVGPGYQVPFAEKVRREAGIPTGAVGMITSPLQAETILNNGQADLILMGRQLLRDPYFPLRAAHELGEEIQWPNQYRRGRW